MSNTWEHWVIDATMQVHEGLYTFVPAEDLYSGNPTFVTGMNVISTLDAFDYGAVKGVIHEDGQEAVERWCAAHPEVVAELDRRNGAS